MCTACDTKVCLNQKSDIQAHLKRAKHLDNENKSTKKEQSLLSFEADSRGRKRARALSEAGISFSKLDDIKFRAFLDTELGYKLPPESSLRKSFLDKVVSDKKAEMQAQLTETDIYLIFDETTNKNQENVVALLVGQVSSPAKPYLLELDTLETVTDDSVTQWVNATIFKLLPVCVNRIKAFITDGGAYCIENGR